jgi:hypothetical protein
LAGTASVPTVLRAVEQGTGVLNQDVTAADQIVFSVLYLSSKSLLVTYIGYHLAAGGAHGERTSARQSIINASVLIRHKSLMMGSLFRGDYIHEKLA